jgi:hypothetical protein
MAVSGSSARSSMSGYERFLKTIDRSDIDAHAVVA